MASITIDVNDLPGRLTEVLELAKAGTEVIVQDATGRAAKLVPVESQPPPTTGKREWKLGLHPGAMVMRADFTAYIDEEDFLKGNV
jgi:antitoxin (DNA-binding transcriptional repressor) of toxin-antitoxin stability system